MSEKDLYKSRWLGLKICALGLAFFFGGVLVGIDLGHWSCSPLSIVGFLTMVIGGVLHYKQFYAEMTADPEELYKKPKSPWEK